METTLFKKGLNDLSRFWAMDHTSSGTGRMLYNCPAKDGSTPAIMANSLRWVRGSNGEILSGLCNADSSKSGSLNSYGSDFSKKQALKEQTSKYGQIVVGVVVPVGLRWETVLNIKQLIGSG